MDCWDSIHLLVLDICVPYEERRIPIQIIPIAVKFMKSTIHIDSSTSSSYLFRWARILYSILLFLLVVAFIVIVADHIIVIIGLLVSLNVQPIPAFCILLGSFRTIF